MRNSVNEMSADKLPEADKATVLKAVEDTIAWLDANQLAEVDEFEAKQKELEGVCNPALTRAYGGGGAGAGGMPGGMPAGGMPAGGSGGPTVEEVD